MHTWRATHIDAYTWASSRTTDGKVALWIVKVNVIKSTCCLLWLHLLNSLGVSLHSSIDTVDRGCSITLFCLNFCWNRTFLTNCLMMFSIIITYFNKTKDGFNFLYFLAVIWIGTRIIMLQHCVFKIKMAFELDNFYMYMYKCVASFSVWYFDKKY